MVSVHRLSVRAQCRSNRVLRKQTILSVELLLPSASGILFHVSNVSRITTGFVQKKKVYNLEATSMTELTISTVPLHLISLSSHVFLIQLAKFFPIM